MAEKKHSFFGSAIMYTLGVILAQGVTFLLTQLLYPINMADRADLTMVGLYNLLFTAMGVIVGLEAASSLNNARFKYGPENLDRFTSSLVSIGVIMLAGVLAIVFSFQGFFEKASGFPVTVLYAAVLQGFFWSVIMLIAQKCRVTDKPGQFVLWTAMVCILRFAVALPMVLNMRQDQYLGDVYGSLIAYTVVGGAAIFILMKSGRSFANKQYWKYCLALTVPLVFHSLASLILGQSAQYVLIYNVGADATAPYTLAYGISTLANAVWLAFNNAWSVWYFDRTEEGRHDEVRDLFKKYAGFVTLLTAGVMLAAPDLIRLVDFFRGFTQPGAAGGDYSQSMYLLPILMLGCFFMFLYTFPVAYETYKHKTKYIAIGTIAAAAVNIVLNIVLVPVLGLSGSAVAALAAYGMLFAFHYVISKFIIKGFQIKFIQLLVPALLMCGVTLLVYALMDFIAVRWILVGVSAAAAFFVFKKSTHIMM